MAESNNESSSSSSANGDEGQLFSFFLYSMVIYPAVGYILSPQRVRFTAPIRIAAAIAFLAFVFYVQLEFDRQENGLNYYQILGLTRYASTQQIKRAFRALSLDLHPDKNRDQGAVAGFAAIKQAHDVLVDGTLREAYDFLGAYGVNAVIHSSLDFQSVLLQKMLNVVSTLVLAFMMTFSDSSGTTFQLCAVVAVGMFLVEYQVIIVGAKHLVPTWLMPSYSTHELISVMHRAFPVFMSGCRSIHAAFFVDHRKYKVDCLKEISRRHNELAVSLNSISFVASTTATNKIQQQLQEQQLKMMNDDSDSNDSHDSHNSHNSHSIGSNGIKSDKTNPLTHGLQLASIGVDKEAVAYIKIIADAVKESPLDAYRQNLWRNRWHTVRDVLGYVVLASVIHYLQRK